MYEERGLWMCMACEQKVRQSIKEVEMVRHENQEMKIELQEVRCEVPKKTNTIEQLKEISNIDKKSENEDGIRDRLKKLRELRESLMRKVMKMEKNGRKEKRQENG